MAGSFRTIVEEPLFIQQKKKLRVSVRRLDEVLHGVTWVLCRKPEEFGNIPGTSLYLAKTDSAPDTPALYVWFIFDDDTVRLLMIEEAPKPE